MRLNSDEFGLNSDNFSYIKYSKLVATVPLSRLNENTDRNLNYLHNFSSFKEENKNHISIMSKSNKTAHSFLKNRSTKQPLLQKLNWCHDLELDNEDINWSQIYKSNC